MLIDIDCGEGHTLCETCGHELPVYFFALNSDTCKECKKIQRSNSKKGIRVKVRATPWAPNHKPCKPGGDY